LLSSKIAASGKEISCVVVPLTAIFIALVGMIDPPREEVKKAVSACKLLTRRSLVRTQSLPY
jgi:hypothetical protein